MEDSGSGDPGAALQEAYGGRQRADQPLWRRLAEIVVVDSAAVVRFLIRRVANTKTRSRLPPSSNASPYQPPTCWWLPRHRISAPPRASTAGLARHDGVLLREADLLPVAVFAEDDQPAAARIIPVVLAATGLAPRSFPRTQAIGNARQAASHLRCRASRCWARVGRRWQDLRLSERGDGMGSIVCGLR